MQTPHGIDTPRNVAKSVGAVVAFLVLLVLGLLLQRSHQADVILGGVIVVGFLALVGWAAVKAHREDN